MHERSKLDELAALKERVASDPNSLQDIMALADAYARRGQWPEVVSVYEAALEANPEEPDLYNELGAAYEEIGEAERGEKACRKAIELLPDHATAYFNLGLLYEEQRRIHEAVAAFEKCLELSPSKEERSAARGKIRTVLKDNAGVIYPELLGDEAAKLAADTITGQSRAAYYLAAIVLLAGSVLNLISLSIGDWSSLLAILVDAMLAVGLLRLVPGARHLTVFRALIGAILWPAVLFTTTSFTTAIIASLSQWGYSGALLLLLTGRSGRWRLIVALGFFLLFTLGIFSAFILPLLF